MASLQLTSAVLFLLFCVITMSDPSQEKQCLTYRAAVYNRKTEGKVDNSNNAMSVVDLNLQLYEEVTKAAKEDGAQIVVFPEWGLFGTSNPMSKRDKIRAFAQPVGNPGDDLTTLKDTSSIVRGLALMAKKHEIVVVANICESVAEGNNKLFNTEVAISEKGELLAKYHKMNPWYTNTFDAPRENEIVTFETSFGVSFGLFICRDLYHAEPQKSLVEERGVTHIPYSVALPVDNWLSRWNYERWAKKNNATILVSNLGGGSGIFSSGGTNGDKKDGYIIATMNV